MIDPITAFAAANAAFKGVKMLVGAGREIQDVSQQLGAVSYTHLTLPTKRIV